MSLKDVAKLAEEEFNSITQNKNLVSEHKFELVISEGEHSLKISVLRLSKQERMLFWRNSIYDKNDDAQIKHVLSSMKFALESQFKLKKEKI